MPAAASLRASLARVLGSGSLAPDNELQQYAVEGVVPKVVAFPSSEEEVAAVLGLSAKEGWAVIPRGSGALATLGGVPEHVDVVLGLTKLGHSIEHVPGDLTVTVGAGSTLGALKEALAQESQWLPLDTPLASQRTVGGILATSLAGPLSLAYGTTRDMVIGMRVAGPGGVLTKSGGKVVKNVTGFDVTKAHLGALGTLGVIIEASFKVVPLPKEEFSLVASFESPGDAVAVSQELASWQLAPQAVEIATTGEPGCLLYARFLGVAASMERRLEECGTRLREAGAASVEVLGGEVSVRTWQWLADFGWDTQAGEGLLLRLGCLPSRMQQLTRAVVDLARQSQYEMSLVIGPGRGALRCFLPGAGWSDIASTAAAVDGFRGLATSVGGYAVVERCSAQAKAHLDVWGDPGEGLALMRRLKQQMDPGRILSPGRFVGGI